MNAAESFLRYLESGRQATTKAARSMFKVENVADLVYRLRNQGLPIYTNRVTLSDGRQTFAYRLGSPSASFQKNMESLQAHVSRSRKARAVRALARARKTLYVSAIQNS